MEDNLVAFCRIVNIVQQSYHIVLLICLFVGRCAECFITILRALPGVCANGNRNRVRNRRHGLPHCLVIWKGAS